MTSLAGMCKCAVSLEHSLFAKTMSVDVHSNQHGRLIENVKRVGPGNAEVDQHILRKLMQYSLLKCSKIFYTLLPIFSMLKQS